MKHKSGRRYGCPCNDRDQACGTCMYCVRILREPDIREMTAWEQLGEMIKEVCERERNDSIRQEECRKIWEEMYPNITTETSPE